MAIIIGETLLNEDYAQELREAIEERVEALRKVRKKMEEAKLDPREPDSKIGALRNIGRLLSPDGQTDGVAEAEARDPDQLDIEGTRGWADEESARLAVTEALEDGDDRAEGIRLRLEEEDSDLAARQAFGEPFGESSEEEGAEEGDPFADRSDLVELTYLPGDEGGDELVPVDYEIVDDEPAGMVVTDPDALPEEEQPSEAELRTVYDEGEARALEDEIAAEADAAEKRARARVSRPKTAKEMLEAMAPRIFADEHPAPAEPDPVAEDEDVENGEPVEGEDNGERFYITRSPVSGIYQVRDRAKNGSVRSTRDTLKGARIRRDFFNRTEPSTVIAAEPAPAEDVPFDPHGVCSECFSDLVNGACPDPNCTASASPAIA